MTSDPTSATTSACKGGIRRRASATRWGLLLLLAAGCASVTPDPASTARFDDLGPLVSRDRAVDGAARVRVAGPLLEGQSTTNGMDFVAVRPFYSRVRLAGGERSSSDLLWPLGNVRDTGDDRSWRFLLGYGADWDRGDDDSRSRWRVFPLLWGGRTEDGHGHFAVFPLGGTMLETLGCDRIDIVLFPLYARTTTGDHRAHHVLWPIVSWAHSDEVDRLRVFPLYGVTTRKGEGTKRFVLWPFWTSARYDDPRERGSSYVLFPLYGRVKTDRQSGWMVLPPLFRYSRGETLTQVNAPWPFVQYSSGLVDRLYLWPLWGRKHQDREDSGFLLWPLVHHRRWQRADGEHRRLFVLPFWYRDRLIPAAATNAVAGAEPAAGGAPVGALAASDYLKVWPLLSYRREGETSALRVLALWPLKHTPAIERNYAPLWTLYARTRDGEAWDEELLWGVWRRGGRGGGAGHVSLFPLFAVDREPATGFRRWSVLGGLLAHEREGLNNRLRLLYCLRFNWGASSAVAEGAETPPSPDDANEGLQP